MPDSWLMVYRCMDENLALSIQSFLNENDIDAVIINKKDSMHLHLTNGEVEVHVNQNDVMSAKHLINQLLNNK